MQTLFEKKIDVNVQNEKYDNALQTTSNENRDQMMQILLKKITKSIKFETFEKIKCLINYETKFEYMI